MQHIENTRYFYVVIVLSYREKKIYHNLFSIRDLSAEKEQLHT